jgi:hypothetical protein
MRMKWLYRLFFLGDDETDSVEANGARATQGRERIVWSDAEPPPPPKPGVVRKGI